MKKIIAIIMALMTTAFTLGAVPVLAGNNTDVPINFTISAISYSKLTARDKLDATPLYCWVKTAVNNATNYVQVRAYTGNGLNKTYQGDGSQGVDHVICNVSMVPNVGKYSVHSYVYEYYVENGNASFAKGTLGFKSPNVIQFATITGEWSVDSTGAWQDAYG